MESDPKSPSEPVGECLFRYEPSSGQYALPKKIGKQIRSCLARYRPGDRKETAGREASGSFEVLIFATGTVARHTVAWQRPLVFSVRDRLG